MCDVWEARYHAGTLAPDADEDGDGFNNTREASAGTNPFDANSHFEAVITRTNNGLSATTSNAVATEKEQTPAIITYSRSGNLSRPFSLFLKTKGPSNSSRSAAGSDEWIFKDTANARPSLSLKFSSSVMTTQPFKTAHTAPPIIMTC
jgi:hypothetical protein